MSPLAPLFAASLAAVVRYLQRATCNGRGLVMWEVEVCKALSACGFARSLVAITCLTVYTLQRRQGQQCSCPSVHRYDDECKSERSSRVPTAAARVHVLAVRAFPKGSQ